MEHTSWLVFSPAFFSAGLVRRHGPDGGIVRPARSHHRKGNPGYPVGHRHHGDEAHARALCGLPGRFGIGCVFLVRLHERLDELWPDPTDRTPLGSELPRPVVRALPTLRRATSSANRTRLRRDNNKLLEIGGLIQPASTIPKIPKPKLISTLRLSSSWGPPQCIKCTAGLGRVCTLKIDRHT